MTSKLFDDGITYLENDKKNYLVFFENELHIGFIEENEGGEFCFLPTRLTRGGYWAGYVLQSICDKLEKLNAPLVKEMDRYFKEHGEL